jgi:hypothetical protein
MNAGCKVSREDETFGMHFWCCQNIDQAKKELAAFVVWTSLGHYLGGYQDRLLGGPLGLPGLRCTAPEGVEHKDCRGEVLG